MDKEGQGLLLALVIVLTRLNSGQLLLNVTDANVCSYILSKFELFSRKLDKQFSACQ